MIKNIFNSSYKRNVNGILLLNKPKNCSSNDILQNAKNIFNAKKAGHTGSLDPIATGLLIICFGEATKFSQYLLNLNKYYKVIIKLGENTSTFDLTGKSVQRFSVNCTIIQIKEILETFIGQMYQVPPIYSAIKYKGKSLYKYARSGILNIPLKKRKIFIYKITFINFLNNCLTLKIKCSKGTYIRSLAYDIGKKLKCGGHVISLKRLMIGKFSVDSSFTIENLLKLCKNYNNWRYEIIDKILLSVDTPVLHFPIINITYTESIAFKNGQKLLLSYKINFSEILVRVVINELNKFIGLGFIKDNKYLLPYRLIVT